MGFGALGKSGNLGVPLSEINVTPMVDVMLVLLIIFMVTAPLMQRGLDVQLPQADAGMIKHNEDQIMIVLTRQGKIMIQNQEIGMKGLEGKLASLKKDNPEIQVYFSADRRVEYGLAVETIAAIKKAGITRLGVVTEPPEKER